MKVKFKGITNIGEDEIESNSIIQKEICGELFIYLNVGGFWKRIKNGTLEIELI